MKVKMMTEYNDSGEIVQRLLFDTHETCRWMMDTRERHIRQALIMLGWTLLEGTVRLLEDQWTS